VVYSKKEGLELAAPRRLRVASLGYFAIDGPASLTKQPVVFWGQLFSQDMAAVRLYGWLISF